MQRIFRFKYRYCKARMAAYLDGEMTPASRRRMGRYIDSCPACYAEYVRQRDLRREMRLEMAALGRPDEGQLGRIWAAVQAEVFSTVSPATQTTAPPFKMRYGFATFAVLVVFWLPFMLGGNNTPPMSVTPPTPSQAAALATYTPPNSTSVAFSAAETQTTDDFVQGVLQPVAVPQVTVMPDKTAQAGQ